MRVLNIDVEIRRACGGTAKVILKSLAALTGQALACIEDPTVIEKNPRRLDEQAPPMVALLLSKPRASPQPGRLG